ncbi:hypothetical protein [Aquimarina sp. 2201CG5-10]|uniref:hypothetical protein n=1 Tax=Aquimarina callyspongiae TaxID=3098150 RepID=UPI002AB5CA86|nr:hypothetical protein [Aquimarina sp. 2201CG5-10]MDY8134039.1 hypothetical protein [Aquimarina sp. 2201CG5-10]
MKKLNVMLLAVAFAISSIATASTEPTKKTDNDLAKEIKQLLKKPEFEVKSQEMAYVTFTLNEDKEIVVLSVDSESDVVDSFIKSRLNYQKVGAKLDSDIKYYKVPVRLVSDD